jgi:hypothetical protein
MECSARLTQRIDGTSITITVYCLPQRCTAKIYKCSGDIGGVIHSCAMLCRDGKF